MLPSLIFCFACFAFADAYNDCPTGKRQSPIDLPSLTTLEDRHLPIDAVADDPQHVMYEDFDGSWGWLLHGSIQRTTYDPFGLGPFWEMQYMTAVEKSEHTIEGKRYDAELQIVFKAKVHNAAHSYWETVRMSVLLETGEDPDLTTFWSTLMLTMNPRSNRGLKRYRNLSLDDLFSKLDFSKYYRYHGSDTDTSRGCMENVYWIVMGDVLKVEPGFLHFLKLKGSKPRDIQDRNGRKIEVDDKPNDRLSFPECEYQCNHRASSSSMIYEAIASLGTQQVVKLFAFIGAASIMFHGAKAVYKGIFTSNEEFQKITDNAEC